MPVLTLAELPFVERDAWELLGLDPRRVDPDPDHDTTGFCRLPAVALEDAAGGVQMVTDALVLGLHSRDDAEPLAGDIELEFVMREGDETYSAVALLAEFLRQRLAGLVGGASAVVLALCNPQRADLRRPAGLGERPLYYAHGDVTAWMQRRPGAREWARDAVQISLSAERWHKL